VDYRLALALEVLQDRDAELLEEVGKVRKAGKEKKQEE
jgi:hypothetical protein